MRHRLLIPLLILTLTGCTMHMSPPRAPEDGLAAQLVRDAKLPRRDGSEITEVPTMDAPLEVLARFWANCHPDIRNTWAAKGLTPAEQQRMLQAALACPECLPQLLLLLPVNEAAQDSVFGLYQHSDRIKAADKWWKSAVASWLMQCGKYLRAELLAAAAVHQEIVALDQMLYAGTIPAALPLAALDWSAAEPRLEHLASQRTQHVAKALLLLYRHARQSGDQPAQTRLLSDLQDLARSDASHPWARDEAFRALNELDFAGRDAFYRALFREPTMKQAGTLSTTTWVNRDNCLAYWTRADLSAHLPFVVGLLRDPDPIARRNAIDTLLLAATPETLAPLLPSLTHPADWPDDVPPKLLRMLRDMQVPAAVGSLESYWRSAETVNRALAALALARQNAPDAGGALRAAAQSVRGHGYFAQAAMRCPTVSEDDVYGVFVASVLGDGRDASPSFYGTSSAEFETPPVNHLAVFARLLDLTKVLRREDPIATDVLWGLLAEWDVPAVDRALVGRLEAETPDEHLYRILLKRRAMIRTREAAALSELARRGQGGASAGLAAFLVGAEDQRWVLLHGDAAARQMLLASAAHQGVLLPVTPGMEMLDERDPALAAAARAYLIFENSPAADAVLRAHVREDYLIIGDSQIMPSTQSPPPAGDASLSRDNWDNTLWRFRKEMTGRDPPDEIIALFRSEAEAPDPGSLYLRVRHGHATLQWAMRNGTYSERILAPEELTSLKQWLAEHPAEFLPGLTNWGVCDGDGYLYAHFTPTGARMVSIDNPEYTNSAGSALSQPSP